MIIRIFCFSVLVLMLACKPAARQSAPDYDVVVYGSTSSGIMAAYTARMKGLNVLLISPDHHLGGLTTGGLGYTDIGNKYAITGLAKDFYREIGKKYGKFEQWIFEPHIAKEVFGQYLVGGQVEILFDYRIDTVTVKDAVIQSISLEHSEGTQQKIDLSATVFIDASYEGDLMAKSGVSYVVGREANEVYDETYNGVQLRKRHQFPDGIDPYKVKGDPSSGLLWGISEEALQPQGSGDKMIQAYNFRICLTNDPGNRIPVTRPRNYDSTRYELLLRLFDAQPEKRTLNDYFIWSRMPNGKTDVNNRGGFSTDMIGMNHDYAEASYAEREQIIQAHEDYTKGLLYFYKTDPRVPRELQAEIQQWGYPKDEYRKNGNWSPQLYVREVRRMVGSYVMTQHHCQGREVAPNKIALAAYTMDSHNCQRIVVQKDGMAMVKNEGNVEIGGFGPYPIDYGAIVPRIEECKNLIVPVCLSASHIAYGSIRMEPVFMALGQVAGLAAELAVQSGRAVQKIDISGLQDELRNNPLSDGSTPEILMDNRSADIAVEGNWERTNRDTYGPDALEINGSEAPDAWVRFMPDIQTSGDYKVYLYFAKLNGISSQTLIRLSSGQELEETTLFTDSIDVQGQTRGEWVPVGSMHFSTDEEAFIEISANNADGTVRADAVLLVPSFGK